MLLSESTGKVYLIGAGPGAADLITVRGARLLAQADVVLHDALVTAEMLELCPQAKKIAVGKRCGQRSAAQACINQQLIDCAHQYAVVVRLKGGDPMLFGRAEEELHALENHGIAVEVVPGITAALAAAAATKQPLTQRGVARSVAFFTSSAAPDQPQETGLPDCDTLAQYMGGREAAASARKLLAAGRAADTPVLLVENCSRPEQRVLRVQLGELEWMDLYWSGPVLMLIGAAMAQRNKANVYSSTTSADAGVVTDQLIEFAMARAA